VLAHAGGTRRELHTGRDYRAGKAVTLAAASPTIVPVMLGLTIVSASELPSCTGAAMWGTLALLDRVTVRALSSAPDLRHFGDIPLIRRT